MKQNPIYNKGTYYIIKQNPKNNNIKKEAMAPNTIVFLPNSQHHILQ